MQKQLFYITLLSWGVWSLPGLSLAHTGTDNGQMGGHMMDWVGWGMPAMGGLGLLAVVTWLVWLVVGVMLIAWLWQQISNSK